MRVSVVDIGTNSTRLLIADVMPDGRVTELARESTVTRLGQGVDTSGVLAPEAMDRVFATLDRYRERIDVLQAGDATIAVLTSAVRDAANGPGFAERVRAEYGLDARTLSGDEEAQLTFLGATAARASGEPAPVVVIDIGGGSTEFVVGARGAVSFHVSTQAGVVRQSERHIHHDPPHHDELIATAEDVRAIFAAAFPPAVRDGVAAGVAVAGTATSCAAILLELVPYDPERVHGFRLGLPQCEELLARLAQMDEDERRRVPGLHPDRASVIVPGVVMLVEAMRLLGLDDVEVSEHDILRGAALRLARVG
ncbi:Ppx/GppA family phosphatase [Paraconexibacter antarcticus]|uniref:Ppx/GppA family phosphatase n=1 Tax=Paraconexibacter antarcticus TaxID=2949664 RepID=A0ABY5DP48_9ACTN|nr:Ppx/GppA family phosphatase [Paraconexibacter antarcticus]UTI63394.1 Ppx/GppA family phosphatase [Paraconexibacter antarcticus]